MTTLPQKTFGQLVSDMIATWGVSVGINPALQAGDALLATFQANASQLVFLQALAQIVNNVARAQTSTGADLDSFYEQFDFFRLPSTFSTGSVVFGKLSPSPSQILIPVGIIVQTPGGAVQYQTVADTAQPTWNPSLNAYVLAPNQSSLTATVQALVAGTGANVAANTLSQIATNLPGIDTVNNPDPINNGKDAEPDASYRSRFILYINSLSKATKAAIESAIVNVQQNIQYILLENETPSGDERFGEFTAVIDDGSGDPPDALILAVSNAIEVVRGFTILPEVVGPVIESPPIVLAVRLAAGADEGTVTAAVASAVATMTVSTPLGTPFLYISAVEQAALSVAGVASVQPGTTTINGAAADFALTNFQRIKVPTGSISVSTYG